MSGTTNNAKKYCGAMVKSGKLPTKPTQPHRPKTVILPRGNADLQNFIFECEGRDTDFKKNLERLALHTAKHAHHGGDMHYCIMEQKMINLSPPVKPGILADPSYQLDYKIARSEYLKHYNVLKSQLRACFSTI